MFHWILLWSKNVDIHPLLWNHLHVGGYVKYVTDDTEGLSETCNEGSVIQPRLCPGVILRLQIVVWYIIRINYVYLKHLVFISGIYVCSKSRTMSTENDVQLEVSCVQVDASIWILRLNLTSSLIFLWDLSVFFALL